MLISDTEIVALMLTSGQQNNGLRHLMTRYQERLYWVIKNIVESHDDTDDVLQNTFIKAYKNIEKFESRSSLFTWLYRIATNEALTFKKSRQKKATVSIIENSTSSGDKAIENENSEDDLLQKLENVLDMLPDRQKQVFKMRYYDELSYEEIANTLQLSEGALKASYHHAVKKIEQYILETTTH